MKDMFDFIDTKKDEIINCRNGGQIFDQLSIKVKLLVRRLSLPEAVKIPQT